MITKTTMVAGAGMVTRTRKILGRFFRSRLLFLGVWGFAGLLVFFSVYHVFYANKIIPGVYVGQNEIGGLTSDQAYQILSRAELEKLKNIELTLNSETFEVSSERLDLEYDWEATIDRAYEVGRTGNFFVDLKDKMAGLVKPLRIKAYYSLNETALNGAMSQVRGKFTHDANDAYFSIDDDGESIEVMAASSGVIVSNQDLYDLLIGSFDTLSFGSEQVPVVYKDADISEEDLVPLAGQVELLVFNPLIIKHENKTWELSPEQKLDFLGFKRGASGVLGIKKGRVDIGLDEPKFEAYSILLSQEVNELPKGRVTSLDGDKVVGFEFVTEGTELDYEAFVNDFKTAFFEGKGEVSIPVKVISGPGDPSKYGIYSLLGEGESNYSGSQRARITNLALAAERTNGVLVPPGQIYSFNNSVGEISGATGYDSAYIISNGRTVLGEGGGVCQTSTTLYRAVLNAGLPIEKRYAHAYRVYYYEKDQPVGFDAAIYQPSLDFQFRNDTPNYVLVESEADIPNSKLYFRIYGTPDNRKVEITEPKVTNVIPPPEALYQDDDSLPKGTVQQVDFSAWGATVSYNRKVTRGDETLHYDTFNSVYQPWRAVYLVGTKE